MSMTISSNVVLALLSGAAVTDALKVKAENLDTDYDAITNMINNGHSTAEALRLTTPAAGGAQLHSENVAKPVQEIRKTSIDSASSAGSGTTVSSSVDSRGSRSASTILNFGAARFPSVFGERGPTPEDWIRANIHNILKSNHPKYPFLKEAMRSDGFEVQEELMDFTMDAKRAIHETWLHPRYDDEGVLSLSTNLPEGRKLGMDSEGRPSFEVSDPFIKNENGSFVHNKLKKMEREAFDAHYEFLAKHVDVLPKKKAKGGKSDAPPIFFQLKDNATEEQKKKRGLVVKIFPKGAEELAATEYFMADLCKETRHRLSALTPYLSLHTVKWDNQTRLVAVMPNVAQVPEKLKFDVTEAISTKAAAQELKRIKTGLSGSVADIKGNPVRGSRKIDHPFWKKEEEHAKNIDHQLNLVIADSQEKPDSQEKRLAADPVQGKKLMNLLKEDTLWLKTKGLTDYSLIIDFYDQEVDAARDLSKVKANAAIIDFSMLIDEEHPMTWTKATVRKFAQSATQEANAFHQTWVHGINIVLNGRFKSSLATGPILDEDELEARRQASAATNAELIRTDTTPKFFLDQDTIKERKKASAATNAHFISVGQ